MAEAKQKVRRRDAALSRAQIVAAAVEILDRDGEAALTFKALGTRLVTGPGAIYNHIASKSDLMAAAADAIVIEVVGDRDSTVSPRDSLRAFALAMFDAIDAHPWVGTSLSHMPGQSPLLRVLEAIGQDIRALGVPADGEWAATMAVFNYIVGVSRQNAANAQFARVLTLDRTEVLTSLARIWCDLNPTEYPFVHSIGTQLRTHDDRADFLAGIDFIVTGIVASSRAK